MPGLIGPTQKKVPCQTTGAGRERRRLVGDASELCKDFVPNPPLADETAQAGRPSAEGLQLAESVRLGRLQLAAVEGPRRLVGPAQAPPGWAIQISVCSEISKASST